MNLLVRLAVSVAIVALVNGCSTAPPQTYTDYSKQFESQRIEPFKRIVFDFGAYCDDEVEGAVTKCEVTSKRLDEAEATITSMNDTVDNLTAAHNSKLDALINCMFSKQQYKEMFELSEKRAGRIELMSMGKQIITGAACAALLWAK